MTMLLHVYQFHGLKLNESLIVALSTYIASTQLLWLMGFLCGWPVSLEFPAGQLVESSYWRGQFQTISEDFSIHNVLMHSAH